MTCFWKGLINSMDNFDHKKINLESRVVFDLIKSLKKCNKETKKILWQNKKLSKIQIKENMDHIKS